MSATPRPRTRLDCDGHCGATFHADSNVSTTREKAAEQGWQFPRRRTARGPSTKYINDVCPQCAPTFQPGIATQHSREWASMSYEERRLRMALRMSNSVLSSEEKARMWRRIEELKLVTKPQLTLLSWNHPVLGRIEEPVCPAHEKQAHAALRALGIGSTSTDQHNKQVCSRCHPPAIESRPLPPWPGDGGPR